MRVIQVGLGGFGRRWAPLARDAPGVDLVAVADAAPAARDWAANALGLPPERVFGSLEAALAAHETDAVLVVTPPETHRAVATVALRAGKHVLVEKPLATTLPDALALVEEARRADRVLLVSQNYRFRPAARAVAGIVAAGALGELLAVRVSCRRDTRALWPADNFRYQMRHPFVLDMAIHHLDLLRAVTGRDIARVYARSWRVPDSPYRHDPAVSALLTLDGGATVTFEGDWATHGPETSWDGTWDLLGEAGRLRWEGDELTLVRGDAAPQRVAPPPLPATDQAATLEALRSAVEDGTPPETAASDNVGSLAAVLACAASIERGEPVDIPALLREAAGVAE